MECDKKNFTRITLLYRNPKVDSVSFGKFSRFYRFFILQFLQILQSRQFIWIQVYKVLCFENILNSFLILTVKSKINQHFSYHCTLSKLECCCTNVVMLIRILLVHCIHQDTKMWGFSFIFKSMLLILAICNKHEAVNGIYLKCLKRIFVSCISKLTNV